MNDSAIKNYAVYPTGTTAKVPLAETDSEGTGRFVEIADAIIALSRADWDESETSWDYKRHPLV